ncbi:MAG: hypothetical protein RIS28_417 [Bacteroidota bacterium]
MQSSPTQATKTMYIIRHGETNYNRLGIVQGSGVDTDINELGQQQADAFYQAYKHIPFQTSQPKSSQNSMRSIGAF